jgi:hypothetical protein
VVTGAATAASGNGCECDDSNGGRRRSLFSFLSLRLWLSQTIVKATDLLRLMIVVYAFISSMSPFPPPLPTSPPLTIATTAAPTKAKEFRRSSHAETSARAARRAAAQNLSRIKFIKCGVCVMAKVSYHK